MGGEWREFGLSEVYDFRSGLSKPRSAFGAGHPFLTFKDVFYNTFTPAVLGDLVDSTEREREQCSVRRGDVFLTRTSETQDELGMSCVALRDHDSATFNGFCKRLRPKDGVWISPEYAAYYFRGPMFRRAMTAMSSLSTRASLNEEMLDRLTIVLPDPATQVAVGAILKTLDDKIELNRKMNATLEAMARALFRSWFVDFDPVRAKAEGRVPSGMDAETAKLFPSEFVDSELGPIPKGWTAGRVGDVIEIHDSRRVPLSSREREQRRGPFPYYGATSVMDHVDAFLFDGRFVLVGEDGSVVTPEGLPFTQYVWGRFWVNNHAHVLSGIRGVSQEHLYLMFQQTNIAAFVTGAVQAKLSQGNMRKIPLVVAPDAVNAKFGAIIDPLFARFRALTEESRTLARLRDDLLPRLLSGELSVTGAERAVEEVA